jgi:hypothetical protein
MGGECFLSVPCRRGMQQQQQSEGHFLKKTCTCSITTTTIYFICYALWGPTRFGWLASFTTTTTTTAAAAAVEVGVFLLIFLELDLSSVSGWDSRPLQHVASHAIRQYGGTTQHQLYLKKENVAITISSRDLAATQVQQRKRKKEKKGGNQKMIFLDHNQLFTSSKKMKQNRPGRATG